MKLIKNIAVAFGLCLGTASYAADGPLVLSNTFSYSREPSVTNNTYWGSGVTVGNYGRQLVNYSADGLSSTSYSGSYVPDLKPKASNVAHDTDGYVEQVWPLPDGSVLFATSIFDSDYTHTYNYLYKLKPLTNSVGNNAPAYDNKQAVLNMGERDNGSRADIRALHHRSILVATINGATVLFYGEYNISAQAPVALWKSTDMGDTWSKAIEWNTVDHQTRHIHGVVQNPYNGWIYILFGDDDPESAIVAWDGVSPMPPDNTPLDQISNYSGWKSIVGSQRVRSGDVVFTPPPNGKLVWIPDVDILNPGENLYGQRANYDLTGLESTGIVPFMDGISPLIGARSPSGNIYWGSFRTAELAPTEQKIHIWKSIDSGLNWTLASKANLYNDWTSVANDLYVRLNNGVDELSITARDMEFASGGAYVGSANVFQNSIQPPVAVSDKYSATANTSATQTVKVAATNGVGVNDQPLGIAGRTFSVVNAITRTGGTGTGSITLNFMNTGAFSYTLKAPTSANTTTKRQVAKRGTYRFSYIMTLNGVSTLPTTVVITVN